MSNSNPTTTREDNEIINLANIRDAEGMRSVPEAADYLRVSESWIRRLIQRRKIKATRLGKRTVIHISTLREIAEHGLPSIKGENKKRARA